MRIAARLLTLICLLISFAIVSASELNNYPLGAVDFSGSGVNLEVSKQTPEHTSISLITPNIVIQDETVNFETYQVIGIPGEAFLYNEGAPTVPQVARLYRIPNTGGVELRITQAEFEVVDNINSFPIQIEETYKFNTLVKDEAKYSQDAWYPESIAVMSEPGIMRDFRVVNVTLFPVQVNPVTHQARIYHNLQVEVVANDQPGINEITTPRRPSGAYASMYRSLIANLDESALDNVTLTPGSYLIICKDHATVNQWVDSLATWKKRAGYDVVVDARNNWTASSMTTAIRAAYSSYDPPLEFVCLIGDPDEVSSFAVPSASTTWGSGDFDHPFALGNTNDDYEDIGVGRLSCSTTQEFATVNAKIMSYERNPYMRDGNGNADTTWFHKGCYIGSTGSGCLSNWVFVQWAGRQFRDFTGINQPTFQRRDGAVDETFIRNQFAGGISVFFWRGSVVGEMQESLPGSCQSGFKLPICLTVTCGAGNFIQADGISENNLTAGTPSNPRGGICGVGSSTFSTHAPMNVCFSGGLAYSIANAHIEHIGHCMNAAKAWLLTTFGPNSGPAHDFSRFNNLMGDPAISIWTDVPIEMDAQFPSTINVGARSLHVNVSRLSDGQPVEEARVVLWKRNGTVDETYEKMLTIADGSVDMPIYIDTPGDLLLTIIKRGHKPFLATINCVAADQMVTANGYYLDDDNVGGSSGNGNGILNPGETIDMPIWLKNFGTTGTASNISAVLSSSNPHITVVNANSSYANIAHGDSAVGNSPFRIQVSNTMQNGETAILELTCTASSIQTVSNIEFACRAGELEFISAQFSGAFDPGTNRTLSLTLRNNGDQDMGGITAQLTSLSPFVTVDDPTASFGSINMNAQGNNNSDQFALHSNALTFRGHVAQMILVTTTSLGFVDTVHFSINVGTALATDPTGPDAYGYYAYDNSDVTYETHPIFNYVQIWNNGGTNLNLNDPGDKTNPAQTYSTARALPFPVTYYGQVYDSITICSNGWVAFGNQDYHDGWRNYVIPAMQAPEAMIAAYWDDLKTQGNGLGVFMKSEPDSHRVIIEWKAQGAWNSTNLQFEVLLLDTAGYPTLDGSNQILVQYQAASMGIQGDPADNDDQGCSIGIQDARSTTGLQYAHNTTYNPGSAAVAAGRAILFTTNARALFGTVQGNVRNAANNLPMQGVDVTIDGNSYHALTNAQGDYQITNVLIGNYTVRASYNDFNDGVVNNVLVELDSTETVNFSLTHPEFDLSADSIHVTVPTEPNQTSFNINNAGNGPLDYSIRISYAGNGSGNPWEPLTDIDVSDLTDDLNILGCEFVNNQWWVTGGNGPNGDNLFYRFDYDGNLVGSTPQPSNSSFGWFDMAYDGTTLFGSDNNVLTGISPYTGQVTATIPSPLNPTRALAYDPTSQHFWVADYTQDLYEIDRQGNIIQQVTNEGATELAITGLAWYASDPDGFKLYIFSQNGVGTLTTVTRMHPVSHDLQLVLNIPANAGERAGGCTITPGWNSTLLVFGGVLQHPTGDRLGIFEVSFNTTWISVTPSASVVPGNTNFPININFDVSQLRPDFTYRVNLTVRSNVLDSAIVLPVALTVLDVAVDPENPSELPQSYALYQNYPNPFNPNTTIRYDLKSSGLTTLTVYNVMGQTVATLVNEYQSAGAYRVNYDASVLGSGVYFYKLESGNYHQVQKMMLLK